MDFIKRNWWKIILGLVEVGFISYGIWWIIIITKNIGSFIDDKGLHISSEKQDSSSKIFVDEKSLNV